MDYITKPISPPVVKARVKGHLELKKARQILKHQNETLVIADVSDKGIPAALFMTVSRTLIASLAVDHRSPSVVLAKATM